MNDLETKIRDAFMRHGGDVQTRPGAWTKVERRVARSQKQRIVTGAVAGALAITGVALALPRLGSPTKPVPYATDLPTTKSTAAPVLRSKLAVSAVRLGTTNNALWALNNERTDDKMPSEVLRIDPENGAVLARVEVGLAPHSFAVTDSAIWVANGSGCMELISCGDGRSLPTADFPKLNSVMRIDPRTNRVVANVAVFEPQDVDVAFGAVWVTTGGDDAHPGTRLMRIDPATNKITADLDLGDTGFYAPLTHDGKYVWLLIPVADPAGFEVARVDPRTDEIERFGHVIEIANATFDITEGFGSVWAIVNGTRSANALARIDPSSGQVIETIELPDASPVGLASVTTGAGYVWATSGRGYLWRIDPATNQPLGDPILIGDNPPVPAPDVVIGLGSAWVVTGEGKIWRFTL